MQFIINDVGLDAGCLKQFGVEVLEVDEMTETLRKWEGWSRLSPETTRIILPGNGALDVQRALGPDWLTKWPTGNIPATRFWWPGVTPESVVGVVIDGFDLLAEDIVVIDDVISSGATIQKVRERHEPWMPKAKWHALSWVIQRNARLKGFSSVYAAMTVGTQSTKAPINSLSTLLTVDKIATSYAERNFFAADCARFLGVIRELRQK